MTKKHFEAMARLVKAILNDEWTSESPEWVDGWFVNRGNRQRATQTAEAFIILARSFNPRFNEQKFLKACGLVS